MEINDKTVLIFTDGASSGNPGPGGFGGVIVSINENKVIEYGGSKSKTTNNEMEMMAVIVGLSNVSAVKENIIVLSDSSYVVNGITKWVKTWQTNGFKTMTGGVVANKDRWLELLKQVSGKKITWQLLPGHSGVIGNERADQLATGFIRDEKFQTYVGSYTDYKLKDVILNLDFDIDKRQKKSNKKTKAYSYVSLIDGQVKKYKTWEDCKKDVSGKKAKFKKTISKEDEEAIVNEWTRL